MTPLETLKALQEKATPGRFINNPHYECVHTHSELVKLRPVLHYSHNNPNAENDAELFACMRNALPDLLAAVDSLSELLANHEAVHGTCDHQFPDICMYCRARAALSRLTTTPKKDA